MGQSLIHTKKPGTFSSSANLGLRVRITLAVSNIVAAAGWSRHPWDQRLGRCWLKGWQGKPLINMWSSSVSAKQWHSCTWHMPPPVSRSFASLKWCWGTWPKLRQSCRQDGLVSALCISSTHNPRARSPIRGAPVPEQDLTLWESFDWNQEFIDGSHGTNQILWLVCNKKGLGFESLNPYKLQDGNSQVSLTVL